MVTAFNYLFNRSIYRITEFFRHWYIKSFFIYSHFVVSQLEKLDRFLAFKITLRYLFKPLYQDYSFLGYILGFIFRVARLIFGGIVYAVIFAIAVAVYIIWLAIPVYIVYQIISNFEFRILNQF
ncbi:MAG TPA: hypothetical protein ENH26_00150 [Candidatus Wolfebacteria bacterium]|nr:hypothetical protein [Candidatus Wolfebacteria bacterium]